MWILKVHGVEPLLSSINYKHVDTIFMCTELETLFNINKFSTYLSRIIFDNLIRKLKGDLLTGNEEDKVVRMDDMLLCISFCCRSECNSRDSNTGD